MKYAGKKLDEPISDVVVIPRNGEDIVFKCQCVTDFSQFDAICPAPEPPKVQFRGQANAIPNYDDPEYQKQLDEYSRNRINWMVLQSLKATEELEWETVDYNNPATWENYSKELEEAGFSNVHVGRIIDTVSHVNGLNERMMDEAKQRFLAGQQAQQQQNSHQEEQKNT